MLRRSLQPFFTRSFLQRSSYAAFCKKSPKGFKSYERKKQTPPIENDGKTQADHEKSEEKQSETKEEKKQDNLDSKKEEKQEEKHQEEKKEYTYDDPPKKNPYAQYYKFIPYMVAGYFFVNMDYFAQFKLSNYSFFVHNYLEKGQVESIQIVTVINGKDLDHYGYIYGKDGNKFYIMIGNVNNFLEHLENYQLRQNKEQLIPISYKIKNGWVENINFFESFTFFALSLALTFYIIKSFKNGPQDIMSSLLGSKKWKTVDKKSEIKFKDVAGQDGAKREIAEFVDFLKKPEKYQKLGARLPKGALLTGPPGTGKTLLAKACAGEAGVPFFFLSGSEFVEMYVGVGASRVRDLFKQAKAKSPSIIFIDEIDAIGKKRSGGRNEERDSTLNQLLVEMDGFNTDQNVIIMAATNRHELLDSALTRPGRFDRSIEVTLPDLEGRFKIFLVHLKPIKLDTSISIEDQAKRLATLTPGFSGADIANLCNEAAILAARENRQEVDTLHFEKASERVLAGYEKVKIIPPEEKKVTAYHESGHAVVSWFLKGGAPLLKLSVIPRSKGSLGFAQYLPNESQLYTQEELEDQISVALGGRVAEEYFFKEISSGASDDLQKVNRIAESLVMKFGMSEEIGYVGFKDPQYYRTHSEKTQKKIDIEIGKVVEKATQRTRDVIKQYEQQIHDLSEALIEKETLDLQQIIEILGERPFPNKSNYKAYLETKLNL